MPPRNPPGRAARRRGKPSGALEHGRPPSGQLAFTGAPDRRWVQCPVPCRLDTADPGSGRDWTDGVSASAKQAARVALGRDLRNREGRSPTGLRPSPDRHRYCSDSPWRRGGCSTRGRGERWPRATPGRRCALGGAPGVSPARSSLRPDTGRDGCGRCADRESVGVVPRTDAWPVPATLSPAGAVAAADSRRVHAWLATSAVGITDTTTGLSG